MKNLNWLLTLLFIISFSSADAVAPHSRRLMKVKTNDRVGCFPEKLWGFLGEVQAKYGRIEIVSGHRGSSDNRRRGGAKGSLHISCRAADFRVPGANSDEVRKYLEASFSRRGGVGLYCGDRFHLDVGRPRVWGKCASHNRYGNYRSTSYSRNKAKARKFRRTGRYSYSEVYDGNVSR